MHFFVIRVFVIQRDKRWIASSIVKPRCHFAEISRDLLSSMYIEVRQHSVSDHQAKAVGEKLNDYSLHYKVASW